MVYNPAIDMLTFKLYFVPRCAYISSHAFQTLRQSDYAFEFYAVFASM